MAAILIVDDEQDLVRLVSKTLTARGHVVAHARDGLAGHAVAREAAPDIIIVDDQLPRVDGQEVCRRFRQAPETKNCRVLLLKSKDISLEEVDAADGPHAFLCRPFTRNALIDVVERLVAEKLA